MCPVSLRDEDVNQDLSDPGRLQGGTRAGATRPRRNRREGSVRTRKISKRATELQQEHLVGLPQMPGAAADGAPCASLSPVSHWCHHCRPQPEPRAQGPPTESVGPASRTTGRTERQKGDPESEAPGGPGYDVSRILGER